MEIKDAIIRKEPFIEYIPEIQVFIPYLLMKNVFILICLYYNFVLSAICKYHELSLISILKLETVCLRKKHSCGLIFLH